MKNLVLVFVIMSLFASCRKSDHLSEIPHITFVSLTSTKDSLGKDSEGQVKFEYEDGDGDIGVLDPNDSLAPLNLFMTFYEKKDGVFNAPVLPDPGYNARIPNLTPKAKDKSISGDITFAFALPINVVNDTIKFTIYIVDRAGHQSNTIETSELVVTTQ